ncbi:MAG: hypothetical protein ACF8Q5_12685 [Phycisphaerales bacterium JB040]
MPCPPATAMTLSNAVLVGLSVIVLALLLTVFNDGDTDWLNIALIGFGSAFLLAGSGRSRPCARPQA